MNENTASPIGPICYPLTEGLSLSRLILGCMHFGGSWKKGEPADESRRLARAAIETAVELGWNAFDHADIYCAGQSEAVFGQLWHDLGLQRDQIILQSKCGIRFAGDPHPDSPHRFDFSAEHIIRSAERSLQRLQTDYLDIYLLHRPDLLAEPEEVLNAFAQLQETGKVRHFGVSNFTPPLLQLFRAHGFVPVANQVEINLLKSALFDSSMVSRNGKPESGHPGDGTLEWHREMGVVTQAWAPLAYGYPAGRRPDWEAERVNALAATVAQMADTYAVDGNAIAIAWLLRHPAKIQPVIGTRDPQRLRAIHQALSIHLTREDWYRLYLAARASPLP